MNYFNKNYKGMILVGVWANRNWILGNWIKEVRLRHPKEFKLWWIPSIYSGKRFVEKLIKFPLPSANAYFFSYPTIFKFYFEKCPKKFHDNSLVLFPHYEPEMGDITDLVKLLNQAHKVYFFCKKDSENLVLAGLDRSKIIIANCAVDNDCILDETVIRNQKTVVLASKYGTRKGADLLPEILVRLQDWNFIVMGRGWDKFLKHKKLYDLSNLNYVKFNKTNRSKIFSKAKIFLSLSNLEGGPVPLIESMSLGVIPISTNTGFAPEFVKDGVNGFLLPINPDVDLVEARIRSVNDLIEKPEYAVSHLTWDRIARLTLTDLMSIRSR